MLCKVKKKKEKKKSKLKKGQMKVIVKEAKKFKPTCLD